MNRLLKAAVALVCALGFGITAHAQMTAVTASNISMGGAAISTGTVTFVPVDSRGTAISFATGGGGLNGPMGFSCTITAGAITGTCEVPDAALTTPANILYSIQISDTSTGNKSSGKAFTLQQVANVTGASWALDHYGPPASTTAVQTLQVVYGSADPPDPCLTPSIYIKSSGGGSAYICVAGSPVLLGGGSGSVTFGTTAGTAAEGNDGRFAANASAAAAAQSTANAAIPTSTKGVANGVASLDETGNVPRSQLSNAPDVNPVTDGLLAEYHFDPSEAGSSAKDYSGENHPCNFGAGGQAPTRTDYGLNFTNESKQYCDTGIHADQAATIIAYVRYPQIATHYSAIFGTADAGYQLLTNNGGFGILNEFPASSYAQFTDAPGYGVLALVRSASGSLLYWNGALLPKTLNGGGKLSASSADLWLGGSGSGCASNTCFLTGDFIGAAVYSTALSAAEIQKVSVWMNTLAAQKGYTPPPQTVTSNAPWLMCDGDSITFGTNAVPFCSYLTLSGVIASPTVLNAGISGQKLSDMFLGEDRIIAMYPQGGTPVMSTIFGGTNDITNQSASSTIVATTAAYLARYIKAAKAAGARVFTMTMLARLSADDVHRNQYNTIIRQNWKAWGADGLVDFAANPLLGANGANTNLTYFGADQIHPTTLSQTTLMGPEFSHVLNHFYGSSQNSPTVITANSYTVVDSDGYVVWTPTAAATGTLLDCTGMTGATFTIANTSTFDITMSASNSQTIVGSAVVSAGTKKVFTCMPPLDPAAGGNYWSTL
jgi:lysophospholipase L1-like esterase